MLMQGYRLSRRNATLTGPEIVRFHIRTHYGGQEKPGKPGSFCPYIEYRVVRTHFTQDALGAERARRHAIFQIEGRNFPPLQRDARGGHTQRFPGQVRVLPSVAASRRRRCPLLHGCSGHTPLTAHFTPDAHCNHCSPCAQTLCESTMSAPHHGSAGGAEAASAAQRAAARRT